MKLSLLISAGILLLAGLAGHQGRSRITQARATLETTEQQVREAGYDPEKLPSKDGKPSRPNREGEGRALAKKLIAAIKIEDLTQDRGLELLSEVCSLGPAGLKALLTEVRGTADLTEENRKDLLEMTLLAMANNTPEALLSLLENDTLLPAGNDAGRWALEVAMQQLAQNDPAKALSWIRKNQDRYPDAVTSSVKDNLLRGIAAKDPALAFSLVGELRMDEAAAGKLIAGSAKSPEARGQILAALRDDPNDAGEPSKAAKGALLILGKDALMEDPAHGGAWLDEHLSKDEAKLVAREFKPANLRSGAGPVLDWIGDKLPPAEAQEKAGAILKKWSGYDYAAVSSWLDSTPDGPGRQNAILAFAGPAAVYQPEAAAGWAASLPESPQKRELLSTIYDAWSRKDSSAADAFARQHGIRH